MKNKKVYAHKKSIINPVTINQICQYIYDNFNSKKRVHEIGSFDNIELLELAKLLNSKSKFSNHKNNLLAKPFLKIFSLKNIINELIKHKKKN